MVGSREESLRRESLRICIWVRRVPITKTGERWERSLCMRAQLCPTLTLWTVSRQAPLSMGFSRWEYWSGLPCPPPGDLPKPGTEPRSSPLQGNSLLTEPTREARKAGQLQIDLELKRGTGVIDIDLELTPPAKTWEWWTQPWRWNLGEIATSKWGGT